MKRSGPSLFASQEARANGFVASGQLRQTFEKRAQVESRSTDDDGKMPARGNSGDGFPRGSRIFAGRENLRWIDYVDQMLRDAVNIRFQIRDRSRNLSRADVESAIELKRIAVDDFSVELGGEAQRERRFSRAGGTDNCRQESV
jgi:hypothetical protein